MQMQRSDELSEGLCRIFGIQGQQTQPLDGVGLAESSVDLSVEFEGVFIGFACVVEPIVAQVEVAEALSCWPLWRRK